MIHDVFVRPLVESEQGGHRRLLIYRYADPLLYRIGVVESVELAAGAALGPRSRPEADEVWVLLTGRCSFHWLDLREGSPTVGARQQHHANEPTLVLVPFGVGFGIRAPAEASLLRLATDPDVRDGGGTPIPWEEM